MSKPALEWARERINNLPPGVSQKSLLEALMEAAFDAGLTYGLIQINKATLDMETLHFINRLMTELEIVYNTEEH